MSAASAYAQWKEEEASTTGELPPAQQLLDSVIASLPATPLKVTAELQAKAPDGSTARKLNVEMRLKWRGDKASAQYTIRDAFGDNREGLNISWDAAGKRSYRYFQGDTLVATAMTNLYELIEGTDISWMDLSLSFLWWPNGRTVGREIVKGRTCYAVDVPAPAGETGLYAGVRIWIDPQIRILLRAQAFDRETQPIRQLDVKSFKKIKDVWVIQDIDVTSLPSQHRTSLRVRQAEILDAQLKPTGDKIEPAKP